MVSGAVAKGSQSAAFSLVVEQTVRKCVSELLMVNAVGKRMIDVPVFTVPVAKFIKQEVERKPFE